MVISISSKSQRVAQDRAISLLSLVVPGGVPHMSSIIITPPRGPEEPLTFKALWQMLQHLVLTQPREECGVWISVPILQAKNLRFKEAE